MDNNTMSLVDMKSGQSGRVVSIAGGGTRLNKLHSLGVTEGMDITKVSSQWMKGPVTIKCRGTEIALGYGIARDVGVSVQEGGKR